MWIEGDIIVCVGSVLFCLEDGKYLRVFKMLIRRIMHLGKLIHDRERRTHGKASFIGELEQDRK